MGNPGDVKPVGKGVSELRIDHGPGYRVYFVHKNDTLIVLLTGGDKRTQDRDIKTAIELVLPGRNMATVAEVVRYRVSGVRNGWLTYALGY
nr:type II toxin-antitoxin system RelE/ParE family toxin [Nodosilinea sp. TSF1-S3]